jgi:hypothetical protein
MSGAGISPIALAEATAPGSIDSLAALLGGFRALQGLEAHFVEEKHLGLLAAPLKTEGVLYFDPPGRMARHATVPRSQVLVVTPTRVVMQDGPSVEVIDLEKKPVVRLYVESFVKILAGDQVALERLYQIRWHLTGRATDPDWEMVLVPRIAPMSQTVKAVEVRGQGLTLTRMRVSELNGDETVTSFSQVRIDRRFTEAERQKLFDAAPR